MDRVTKPLIWLTDRVRQLNVRNKLYRIYTGSQRLAQQTRNRFPQLQHYISLTISLTRLDRPIGIYLLLWPTLWALWLVAEGWPGWHLFTVFTLGVVLTRSAGCIMNDIADRNYDHLVERTKQRPLALNQVSLKEAMVLAGVLLLIAFMLVLTTNLLTILLSFGAVAISAIYPLMKRYTYMPQAVLGVAFSWGIPMAFAAHSNEIPQIAWLLLVANVLWTVAYDTQYAMVDRDDDIKLGLKSSAILFGDLDRLMIAILQGAFVITLLMVAKQAELGLFFEGGLIAAISFLLYQQYLIRDRERQPCFQAFQNNHWVGLVIFTGLALDFLLS